jgi:cobalamin biosynthesis protein CobT
LNLRNVNIGKIGGSNNEVNDEDAEGGDDEVEDDEVEGGDDEEMEAGDNKEVEADDNAEAQSGDKQVDDDLRSRQVMTAIMTLKVREPRTDQYAPNSQALNWEKISRRSRLKDFKLHPDADLTTDVPVIHSSFFFTHTNAPGERRKAGT